MDLISVKKIINQIYNDIDGHSISAQAKKKLNYTDKTLVYGEILIDSFCEILKEVNPKENEVFYDLGCGVGKPVIAAALLFPFNKSIGIELLKEIYLGAIQAKLGYETVNKKEVGRIEFINRNIFDTDFSDADIVFAHCTCFPNALMIPLSKKLEKLKKGSRVIIVTRSLYSDNFLLKKFITYQMGWGKALVNFYEKIK